MHIYWSLLYLTNNGWFKQIFNQLILAELLLCHRTPALLWKVCRLSSWLTGSLWNHTSLVSKREKSTLILTPPRCLKRHSSCFKYEKVSNSQPTQQTRYIQELEGPWQVYEWGRGRGFGWIVGWVQVIPGQGRSQPGAGTSTPCCTSTNEYSQPTMNTQNVYKYQREYNHRKIHQLIS